MPRMAAATPAQRPTLIYDGSCSFCRRSVRWFQAHDTHQRLAFLPRESADRAQQFPQIDAPQYQGSMQLILPNGTIRSGAGATAGALRHLSGPGWRALGWSLQRWGIRSAAQLAYRWIAKNRHRFRCDDGGCAV